jgi:hypothetical protein
VAAALEAEAEANKDPNELKDKADLATKAAETAKSTAQRNRKAMEQQATTDRTKASKAKENEASQALGDRAAAETAMHTAQRKAETVDREAKQQQAFPGMI